MHLFELIAGVLACAVVMVDAFQTIILPRRPKGRFRLTRIFYLVTWKPWSLASSHIHDKKAREQFLSIFGPFSLLLLFLLWGTLLVASFASMLSGLGTPYLDSSLPDRTRAVDNLRTDLYVSGTTLTTLGPGDVVPRSQIARLIMVIESATGLGFVALVISYVPVLYTAFSHREVSIALLDARAGSPPTSSELLARHTFQDGEIALIALLAEWERWSAEILESHISYPILCFYRSQHDNQSWLAALTTILDTCALLITSVNGPASRQAQLTFAVARHAAVDLGHVFQLDARQKLIADDPERDRLPPEAFKRLCTALTQSGIRLCGDRKTEDRLGAIRKLYEPQVIALADQLRLGLPLWIAEPKPSDQWHTVESLRFDGLGRVLGRTAHVSGNASALNLVDNDSHGI